MAFPLNPINSEVYTNAMGTHYIYNSTDNKWNIQSQDLGVTGIQGYTGREGAAGTNGDQGVTGAQGVTVKAYTGMLNITVDANGALLTPGYKGEVRVPYNCLFSDWEMYGDTGGSAVINPRYSSYASYPTSSKMSGSLVGPSLSLSVKNRNTDITGWTGAHRLAGDLIRFEVESVTGLQRISLNMRFNIE